MANPFIAMVFGYLKKHGIDTKDMTVQQAIDKYQEINKDDALTKDKDDAKILLTVGRTLGAGARNYPVKLLGSNQHAKLAEGQTIEGRVFAGKGTKTEIRDRFRLEADYKIPADEWKKVSGNGIIVINGKQKKAELHWYEAKGERYEIRVKRYLE